VTRRTPKSSSTADHAESSALEAPFASKQERARCKFVRRENTLVPPGGIERETIALETIPTPTATVGSDPHRSDEHRQIEEPANPTQRNISLAMLGTAAALVATSFVGIGARELEVNSYNDDPSCPGRAGSGQPPLCQSKIDTAQTWTTISIVGFVSAGALTAGGAVLLLTAPRAHMRSAGLPSDPRKYREKKRFWEELTCAPGLGIVCSGRF
jgi:hypothetical protein